MSNGEFRNSIFDVRHWTFGVRRWRRSTLPPPREGSTIDADRLNDRVRDGNGCGPVALVASSIWGSGPRAWGLGFHPQVPGPEPQARLSNECVIRGVHGIH